MADRIFHVPMPEELKEALLKYAKAHDMSMSQVVRMCLREFIESHEDRPVVITLSKEPA